MSSQEQRRRRMLTAQEATPLPAGGTGKPKAQVVNKPGRPWWWYLTPAGIENEIRYRVKQDEKFNKGYRPAGPGLDIGIPGVMFTPKPVLNPKGKLEYSTPVMRQQVHGALVQMPTNAALAGINLVQRLSNGWKPADPASSPVGRNVVNLIYEGTNTIQSLDLLGRKVLSDMGAKLKKFGKLVETFIDQEGSRKEMSEFIDPLADMGDKVKKLTMELGMKAMTNQEEVGAAAVPYLRVVGHLVYAYLFARMAKIALDNKNSTDPIYKQKLAVARFYFAKLLPETAYQIRAARAGASTLMALEADLF